MLPFTNSLVSAQHDLSSLIWYESAIPIDDCNNIINFCSSLQKQDGLIKSPTSKSSSAKSVAIQRKAKIAWLPQDDSVKPVYNLLGNIAVQANEQLYRFRIDGFSEKIQYSEYPEGGGHYDWHIDIGKGHPLDGRKLSMVVQLSDPSEYDGGDLLLKISKNENVAPKAKGTVIVFPSYMMHKVTPVTRGCRKSLAVWLAGPPFA